MPVKFHTAEFINAEQVNASVAGDGLVELLVVGDQRGIRFLESRGQVRSCVDRAMGCRAPLGAL
jgi:hypothetical protein